MRTLRTQTAVCSFLMLIASSLVSLAPSWASQGDSGQITTAVPDLRSVTILHADPFDSTDEIVGFCFDQELSGLPITGVSSKFTLVDFNSVVSLGASSAHRIATEPQCIQAHFPSGLDINLYSIGTVADGAVSDTRGSPNVQASAPLEGSALTSEWGNTTAPDLIGAEPVEGTNTVVYEFDENLDPEVTQPEQPVQGTSFCLNPPSTATTCARAVPRPQTFSLYNSDNVKVDGQSIVSIVRNTVEVGFGSADLSSAVRFSVADHADGVADRQKVGRAGQKNNFDGFGGTTSVPDLTAARLIPGTNQIDFDFDELVEAPAATNFLAFTSDGQKHSGTQASGVGNGRIRVIFGGIVDFPDRVVRVATAASAVKASRDTTKTNSVTSLGIAPSRAAIGFTDGPDLIKVSIDENLATATFEFDTVIKRLVSATSSFRLVTDEGKSVASTAIIQWGDQSVTMGFSGAESTDIQSAVGGSVNAGAVEDLQGKKSPVRTLTDSFRVEAPDFEPVGPPIPSPSPSPSPPSPSPPSPSPSPSPSLTPSPSASPSPTSSPSPSPTPTSKPPVVGAPTQVRSSGDMTTTKGKEETVSITVIDDAGTPIPDAPVSFETEGVGTIREADSRTDLQGKAFATMASTEPGPQAVMARVGNCAAGSTCVTRIEIRWVSNRKQLSCTIVGTKNADVIRGTSSDDVLCGFGGDDVVYGGAGEDLIMGGSGHDLLRGESGADLIKGQAGRDVIRGGGGKDSLFGGPGKDRLDGGRGKDVCASHKKDRLTRCED